MPVKRSRPTVGPSNTRSRAAQSFSPQAEKLLGLSFSPEAENILWAPFSSIKKTNIEWFLGMRCNYRTFRPPAGPDAVGSTRLRRVNATRLPAHVAWHQNSNYRMNVLLPVHRYSAMSKLPRIALPQRLLIRSSVCF